MDTKLTPLPNANKALWEKGDFTRIAATMLGSRQKVNVPRA